ncbi:hypothetical protein OOT46_11285 [Aquabacterium sp. A7-Y]|uniref:hypothetical protein n=1 Tax=Aquabacterium sp. A7-Y TaxID=1349605 RepID=UPI00223D1EE3|nr:hypothetical protein [Aquabacterium sp. A7-Y]MCW7538423.1 hypothetical protein [Aquabacterium sp. A7-Y]
MPFIGLGVHMLVALFFAVHAVRTGRQMYWLFILFSFPLLGSIVYFLVEYLPASRVERGVRNVTALAVRTLDPTRELREARQAFELSPTAQNHMRLAEALLDAGATAEAVQQFDLCLQGPFAKDPEIRFAAARARLANGEPVVAAQMLSGIRLEHPEFRVEALTLQLAQALARSGQADAARTEFAAAVNRFGSVDARAEYAIWAASVGDLQTARTLRQELEQAWKHWPRHARSLHRPLLRRVDDALAAAAPKA